MVHLGGFLDLRRQIIESFEMSQTGGPRVEASVDLSGGDPMRVGLAHQIKYNGDDLASLDMQFQGLLPTCVPDGQHESLNASLNALRDEVGGR